MGEPLTIRWDDNMGCYRVSEPNFAQDAPVRVFREEDVRALWEANQIRRAVTERRRHPFGHLDIMETLERADAFSAPEEWKLTPLEHDRIAEEESREGGS